MDRNILLLINIEFAKPLKVRPSGHSSLIVRATVMDLILVREK